MITSESTAQPRTFDPEVIMDLANALKQRGISEQELVHWTAFFNQHELPELYAMEWLGECDLRPITHDLLDVLEQASRTFSPEHFKRVSGSLIALLQFLNMAQMNPVEMEDHPHIFAGIMRSIKTNHKTLSYVEEEEV